jgi:hypothetical protein
MTTDEPAAAAAGEVRGRSGGEGEGEKEKENGEQPIPVIWGYRPPRPAPEARAPARQTVRRSDKLVAALTVPRMSLYNARSLWAKIDSLAEDMKMRQTDLVFLSEVWERAESKKHENAIEKLL